MTFTWLTFVQRPLSTSPINYKSDMVEVDDTEWYRLDLLYVGQIKRGRYPVEQRSSAHLIAQKGDTEWNVSINAFVKVAPAGTLRPNRRV